MRIRDNVLCEHDAISNEMYAIPDGLDLSAKQAAAEIARVLDGSNKPSGACRWASHYRVATTLVIIRDQISSNLT